MSVRHLLLALFALTLAAGCQGTPSYDYRTGDVLLEADFSRDFAWDAYSDPMHGTHLRAEDGVYRMQMAGGGYIWVLNRQPHTDVVIEVYGSQLGADDNNAFGVMCRADPSNNGEGYYFYISADGYWSIRRSQGRTVTSLVDFTRSDAIHQGRSINLIRVLCVDDYLALYVNDRFVGETRDRAFQRGVAGFTVAAAEGVDVDVSFDNLRILAASLIDK